MLYLYPALHTTATYTCTCKGITTNIAALGTPQLLASLDSLRLDHMILLDNVSGGSGYVHRIVDLLNTPELIEISSDDKKLED